MKPTLVLILLIAGALGIASAQQDVTISGIIKSEEELPDYTVVAIHVLDAKGAWQEEIASSSPIAGTFSISTTTPTQLDVFPFRGGAIPLPGLQNEYSVTPEDVGFLRARVNVYIDHNQNQLFDCEDPILDCIDGFFLGVPTVEDPIGFFNLLYVDKDATISGRGTSLSLKQGWNIYTVRFPEGETVYEIANTVDDALLDIFIP